LYGDRIAVTDGDRANFDATSGVSLDLRHWITWERRVLGKDRKTAVILIELFRFNNESASNSIGKTDSAQAASLR
jgi:hypothetical protein